MEAIVYHMGNAEYLARYGHHQQRQVDVISLISRLRDLPITPTSADMISHSW